MMISKTGDTLRNSHYIRDKIRDNLIQTISLVSKILISTVRRSSKSQNKVSFNLLVKIS